MKATFSSITLSLMSLISLITPQLTQSVTTILASSLSCGAPTVVNESAIIEMDVPITIAGPGLCELIAKGAGFAAHDTITFQAAASNTINLTSITSLSSIGMIQIDDPAIWDVRSFNQATQAFNFNNIIINMDPGTAILADGITFNLNGTSELNIIPVSQPAP